ncbi:MAG: penicillin-binding protein activator [Pseudomonadales bacterium]|nr:penicillin-binding protein activator [Pseudomonadales bacterium]
MPKRVARFILYFSVSLFTILGLSGCGDPSARVTDPNRQTEKPTPIASLLAQAQQLRSPDSEQLLLKAVRLLRQDGKTTEASNILTTIDGAHLPTQLQADFVIETALQALYNLDPELAVSILTTDRMNFTNIINRLDDKQSIESSLLRAIAWEHSGNFLAAARERIFIAPLLPNEDDGNTSITGDTSLNTNTAKTPQDIIHNSLKLEKSRALNAQQIWLNLTTLDAEELLPLSLSATFEETKGWFQLAWLFRAHQDNLDSQITELNRWLTQYPEHPAASPLPQSLGILSQLVRQRPNRIALLLPQEGPYLPASRAIQNGFLAAHYTDTKSTDTKSTIISNSLAEANAILQPQTSSQIQTSLQIRVYDSSNTDSFINTYQQAVLDGAELIIGALQKENVKALQHYSLSDESQLRKDELPVPTIALNRGDINAQNPSNLFQFGLSPDDEARQVATHALEYEYKNAAVLYPDSPWGERVFNAFNEQWTRFGGTTTASATFDNKGNYSSAIKQMLMIQQSQSRANQLKRMLGTAFEFQPRRRQDIDFVFILASPKQARQIKPLLDFHYASNIPVYATSHIYSGKPKTSKDRDINGIEFCDIPWLLATPTETQKNLNHAWPNTASRYRRLNALGVDAYRLHARIQLLTGVPGARFFGATGVLSLSQKNLILRELNWAKFKKGKPAAVPKNEVPLLKDKPQGSDNEKQWNQQQWRTQPQQQQQQLQQQQLQNTNWQPSRTTS